jgi:hypothetical protein
MKGNEQVTPLQFMLRVLNDEKAPMEHRMWAAANAAPSIHQRLPVVTEGGDRDEPLVRVTAQQLSRLSEKAVGPRLYNSD